MSLLFLHQHTAHYKSAINMFRDQPIIGQGPRMFRILCKEEKFKSEVLGYSGCSSHPHNTYIQLLAETGAIGFFLFSLCFLHIIFKLFKHFYIKLFFRKKLFK